MVDIWLPYGKTEVYTKIAGENLMEMVEIRRRPGVENVVQEIENAIRELSSSLKLAEVARPDGKIVLALNFHDITLAELIVSSFIRWSEHSGIKGGDLTVLFANNPLMLGTPNVIKYLKEKISSLGINTVMHDPSNNNIYVCDTKTGIKIYLDKTFYDASIRIMVSTVEPNPYILYDCCESGISFGLTGLETIKSILAPLLSVENLQERVFKEAVEISRVAKVDANISIVRNLGGGIIGCFTGEPEKVLHESVDAANSLYEVAFRGESDIVIVSPGGAPLDNNIFSACRCLENAVRAAKRNGFIILVAECSEGYGEPDFHRIIRRINGDLNLLERILEGNFSVSGFIAYRFLRTFKKANVMMVSAIPDYYASEIPGLKIFRTVNEALNYALGKLGAKARVTVIPYGNLIVPATKEKEQK